MPIIILNLINLIIFIKLKNKDNSLSSIKRIWIDLCVKNAGARCGAKCAPATGFAFTRALQNFRKYLLKNFEKFTKDYVY